MGGSHAGRSDRTPASGRPRSPDGGLEGNGCAEGGLEKCGRRTAHDAVRLVPRSGLHLVEHLRRWGVAGVDVTTVHLHLADPDNFTRLDVGTEHRFSPNLIPVT